MYNQQNPYNQPSQMGQPMMPPPPMPRNVVRNNAGWKQRFLSGNSGRPLTLRQERTLPNWVIGGSVYMFFIAFAACLLAWGHPMETELAVLSAMSVLFFFYGSKATINGSVTKCEKVFIRDVFVIGLIARLAWMLYSYFFFNPEYYGTTYGEGADVEWYMPYGQAIAEWIRGDSQASFSQIMKSWGGAIDDVGYPFWLAIINILSFGESDVFLPFVLKCIIGAYCVVCVYHVAKRHFGNGIARMTAVFVALNPNMIYWCASMFKETEMVFLCCLCVDLVDKTFTSGKRLSFRGLLPGVLAGMAVFFFRAPLAMVLFLSMLAHVVMASNRVMSLGKKIIAGIMVGIVLLIGMGDRLKTQAENIAETVQSDKQKVNMEWRAERQGGNEFAKYAGAAVFAPLIFTIPFPTFNEALESQVLQMQLSGGSYIKNIFSFFVIWVLITMLLSGEWRRHVFILAYTLGYLASLVLSNFAQSGRFHMPVMPMLMLLAAYGIQLGKTNPRIRRLYPIVLVIEVVACLGWNWFKLKGRGMI